MAIIALEGIRLHGRHGYYPEEEILGTEFIIDVYVETNIKEAADSDELMHTVNYETIYLICQREMKNTSSLIEKTAQNIADEINDFFSASGGRQGQAQKNAPATRRVGTLGFCRNRDRLLRVAQAKNTQKAPGNVEKLE